MWPIEYDETVQISKLSRNRQKMVTVAVHPEVLSSLKFKQHPTKKLAVAAIACHLSAYNDEFKLVPSKEKKVVRRKLGNISVDKLLRTLRDRNLKVNVNPNEEDEKRIKRRMEETVLDIPELHAKISIRNDCRGIKITVISTSRSKVRTDFQAKKDETRQQVLGFLKTILIEDDGLVGRKTQESEK